MRTITNITYPAVALLTLASFALSPLARAVDPPPDGGYPNQNTAESEHALFSRTTDTDTAAMGFHAPDSNTVSSDNALATWIWRATADLNIARGNHTATLLQNGMVLVAGGNDSSGNASASAELYDPASGTWTVTGSLNTERVVHTATLLQNGMVLVAGGLRQCDIFTCVLRSAELYDPAAGTWIAAGSLSQERYAHTAILLQNGNVLVAGGLRENAVALASAELGHGRR